VLIQIIDVFDKIFFLLKTENKTAM
jgi:hypothetical protein